MYSLKNTNIWANPDRSITDQDFIWKNKPANYEIGVATLNMNDIQSTNDLATKSNNRHTVSDIPLTADVLERLIPLPSRRYKNIYTGAQQFEAQELSYEDSLNFIKLFQSQDVWQMSMFLKRTIMWDTYRKEGKFRHPLCAIFNEGTGKYIIEPGQTRLKALQWHGVKEVECLTFSPKQHTSFSKVLTNFEHVKKIWPDLYGVQVYKVADGFWVPSWGFDHPDARSDSLIKEYYSKIRQFWLTHNLCWDNPIHRKVIYWEPRTATGNCHITVSDKKYISQAIAIAPLFNTWDNDNIKIVNTDSVTAPE